MGNLKEAILREIGTVTVHRVRMLDIALTDNADVYISLLTTDDDPNYDIETDGTQIAECHVGSKIIDINLKMILHGGTAGDRTELILYRDPDVSITTTMTPAGLFDMDVSPTSMALRKVAMWYDMHIWSSGSDKSTLFPRIRRAAMGRNSKFRDLDALKLLLSQNDGGTGRELSMVGRITTRH